MSDLIRSSSTEAQGDESLFDSPHIRRYLEFSLLHQAFRFPLHRRVGSFANRQVVRQHVLMGSSTSPENRRARVSQEGFFGAILHTPMID